jgi:hypothetical protein
MTGKGGKRDNSRSCNTKNFKYLDIEIWFCHLAIEIFIIMKQSSEIAFFIVQAFFSTTT